MKTRNSCRKRTWLIGIIFSLIVSGQVPSYAAAPDYEWFATDASGYYPTAQAAADNYCLTVVQSLYGSSITIWYAEPNLNQLLTAPLSQTYTFDCHGYHNWTNSPIVFSSTQSLDTRAICADGSNPLRSLPLEQQCPDIGSMLGGSCPIIGNPITIGNGNKYQTETDYLSSSNFPLRVQRSYNSLIEGWRFFPEIRALSSGAGADIVHQDGKSLRFMNEGGVWVSDPDVVGVLNSTADMQGNITGWTYTTSNDQTETYDAQGRLQSVTARNGMTHTFAYQADSITVTHTNGNILVYQLDSEGQIIGFVDPDNRTYQYSYDTEGRLISITFPDETPTDATDNPERIYHYENSAFPNALTGITDENGNRYATWAYDDQGRAISSEHANGVDKTTLIYNADGTTTVTNPLGKQTTYHFTTTHGVKKVTQVEGHPTASCEGANKAYTYDANGFLASKTDWNGNLTTYVRDSRGLELSRTEASGTPEARTITTEWHPQFRLPTKISEPNKITEYTYDAQGRQLSSNVRSQ